MTNAITKRKPNLAKLGSALVAEAKKKLNEDEEKKYKACVEDVLRKIRECEQTIRIGKAGLAHFTAQKEALEAGAFHFHLFRPQIIFNDDELNQNYQEK